MWGRKKSKRRSQQDQIHWERHRLMMAMAICFGVVGMTFALIVMGYYVHSLVTGQQTPTLAHMSDLLAGFFKVVAAALGT